ncbi:MAG: hypothetical protein ACO1N5_10270 [Noviherbaspirillum sp.]
MPESMLPALAPATSTAARPQSTAGAARRPPPDLARVSEQLAAAMPPPGPLPGRQPRRGISWRSTTGAVLLAAGAALGGAGGWWLVDTPTRPAGRALPLGVAAVPESSSQAALPEQDDSEGAGIASLALDGQDMEAAGDASGGSGTYGPDGAAGVTDVEPMAAGEEIPASSSPNPATGTASRPKPSPAPRDREAESPGRQAAQETAASDEEPSSAPAPRPRASARPSRAERKARNLPALCADAGNFFQREQCKWRVCDGHWGKHGCPPPARNVAAY